MMIVNCFFGVLSFTLIVWWWIRLIKLLRHWVMPTTRRYARRLCLISFGNLVWWALTPLGNAGYLEVYLVSDEEIRRLNRRFRGKDKPTNVLSFSSAPDFLIPKARQSFLGEIFLAPDYAFRQKESMARLLVHGLLHLFGYTHLNVRDKIKMEVFEERVEIYLRRRKIYF